MKFLQNKINLFKYLFTKINTQYLPMGAGLIFQILQDKIKKTRLELDNQLIKNNNSTEIITKRTFNIFGSKYTFNITKNRLI